MNFEKELQEEGNNENDLVTNKTKKILEKRIWVSTNIVIFIIKAKCKYANQVRIILLVKKSSWYKHMFPLPLAPKKEHPLPNIFFSLVILILVYMSF